MTAEFIIRLILAAIACGAIGMERQMRGKGAGLRTHVLIGMGSALFMIVSKYGFADVLSLDHVGLDPSRIAAQVVTGVGFIGAGNILVRNQNIVGLTTAADIWVTAAIGMVIGSGMYEPYLWFSDDLAGAGSLPSINLPPDEQKLPFTADTSER